MNHLLNNISWTTYLQTVGLLAITSYAFIGWKYYRSEINQLFARLTGRAPDANALPEALRYEGPDDLSQQASPHMIATSDNDSYCGPVGPLHELNQQLTACIGDVADKAFNPGALIPKLKKILNEHPDIAASHERDEINALVVRECERTGTALLSESEVDLWWSA